MMSKNLFLSILLSTCATFVMAQQKNIVQGKFPKLYIWHTVVAEESLYSISSAYHLSTKLVAKENQLKEKSILKLGEKIKILLNNNNFDQSIKVNNTNLIPIYYIVHKKETLPDIAQKNGSIKFNLIKSWNNLNNNKIFPSQKIIIGFLKRQNENSINIHSNNSGVISETKNENEYDIPEKNKTPFQVVLPHADTLGVNDLMNNLDNEEASDNEGYYVDSFPVSNSFNQPITLKGKASSFKSSSGWTDKKYFVIINGVAIGTIVRLTNPSNNRSICAKVIGGLPIIKSNLNLLIRVSSAAAHALKLTENNISITVIYFK
jgi:LysM repeat protein